MQLSQHIGKAAWSTADKLLYLLIGLAYILPQKVIGESNWGIYTIAQTFLTIIYLLTDGFALQAMVNFGMDESRRTQSVTIAALTHSLFILICTTAIYFGRDLLALLYNDPGLEPVLALFPLTALGFLLRNYFLKVAQLHIDTRAAFIMDAAWIGVTVLLIVMEWSRGTLSTAEDMMIISAVASGASSLTGLALFGRTIRFTRNLDRGLLRKMLGFGATQLGSAATIALQTQGDVMILGGFVSSGLVGNYDAAKKFFRGFEAIRDAGALFVYPATARLQSQGRRREMVLMVEKMMGFMLIVIVPLVALIWLGPTDYFFNMIYRGKYQEAAGIFKLLSLAALAIPFSMNMNVLNGMGEVKTFLRVTVTSSLLFFLGGIVLVPLMGVNGQVTALIVGYAALGTLSTLAVRSFVPFRLRSVFGRWRDAAAFAARAWQRYGKRGRGKKKKGDS